MIFNVVLKENDLYIVLCVRIYSEFMVRVYVDLPKWLVSSLDEYADVLDKSRNEVVKDVLVFGVKDYGEFLNLKDKIGKDDEEEDEDEEDEDEEEEED